MNNNQAPFNLYFSGSCKVNITCDCDVKPEVKPERQAALFAKEFQDKLYQTIFTKDEDDNDETTTAASTTVAATTSHPNGSNQTNCSNDVQVSPRISATELGGRRLTRI